MTPIIASAESDKPRELPDADIHNAVCVWVADLGKHPDTYPGKPTAVKHKVQVGWEIEQVMADGRRFHVSLEYTLSLWDRSKLYKHLTLWRGKEFSAEELKGFDLAILVGKPCRVSLIPTKSGKSMKVDSVLAAKKGWEPFTPESTEVPAWVDTKRFEYAAELDAFLRSNPSAAPADYQPPETAGGGALDEVPFLPFDAPF